MRSPGNGVVGVLPFRQGALVGPEITQPLTTVSDNSETVSYTHLDVYKRQLGGIPSAFFLLSTNINRPTYSLQDVDGDGYLDIVESEKESELKVTRSAIGRTNMLKSVTNSLGGTFTLDYAHTTPTYGLPGGKWVMSALTIDDGIHDDGPVMTTAFEYKDGKRDRHEREFLGFGEVITKNLDTENGNSVYRQAVENYDVANYYTQGNVTATSVEDANGNKYTETKNRYDSYYMTADGDKYTCLLYTSRCV